MMKNDYRMKLYHIKTKLKTWLSQNYHKAQDHYLYEELNSYVDELFDKKVEVSLDLIRDVDKCLTNLLYQVPDSTRHYVYATYEPLRRKIREILE